MKHLKYILFSFIFYLTSCQIPQSTVVIPEGQKATQLDKAKDDQITGLIAQVKSEQDQRVAEEKQAALAAADFDGIVFAVTHVDPGLPRNAIEEEAKLGKARLPDSDPQEVIKAKDRVIAILQNEVAQAKTMYDQAYNDATQAKAHIVEQDKQIAVKQSEISTNQTKIASLEQDKIVEQKAHVDDITKALKSKDDAIQQLKDKYDAEQRKWWVNAFRLFGMACIAGGVLLIVVFKIFSEGVILAGCGLLIGLASIGIDILTKQPWFPYACGGIGLIILVGGVYAVYRMWKTHTLHTKITAALQDVKDEATATGTDTWTKIEAYLKYRLGDSTSFWGSAQTKIVQDLGLVDKAGEAQIKTAQSVTTPNPVQIVDKPTTST